MAMEFKNTSQKVISIGNTIVLPDSVIEISDEQAEFPSVKAFIKRGYASVSKKNSVTGEEKRAEEIRPSDALDPADTPTVGETDAADANASSDTEGSAENGSTTGKRGRNK